MCDYVAPKPRAGGQGVNPMDFGTLGQPHRCGRKSCRAKLTSRKTYITPMDLGTSAPKIRRDLAERLQMVRNASTPNPDKHRGVSSAAP